MWIWPLMPSVYGWKSQISYQGLSQPQESILTSLPPTYPGKFISSFGDFLINLFRRHWVKIALENRLQKFLVQAVSLPVERDKDSLKKNVIFTLHYITLHYITLLTLHYILGIFLISCARSSGGTWTIDLGITGQVFYCSTTTAQRIHFFSYRHYYSL